VILHDNPANLHYVYHHLRLISEPLSAHFRSCSQRRKATDWRRPPLRAVAALLPTGCPTIRLSDHRGLKDFLNLHRGMTHLGGQNDLSYVEGAFRSSRCRVFRRHQRSESRHSPPVQAGIQTHP
jgi:hypothetical protein